MVALIKTSLDWRLMNDSHVTYVNSESSVVTPAAYVLFYKRRQLPPIMSPPRQPFTTDKQERATSTLLDGSSDEEMELGDSKGEGDVVNSFDDDINNDDVRPDRSRQDSIEFIKEDTPETNRQLPLFSSRIEEIGDAMSHQIETKKEKAKVQELGQSQSSSDSYEVIQSDSDNENNKDTDVIGNKLKTLDSNPEYEATNDVALDYTDMDEMD